MFNSYVSGFGLLKARGDRESILVLSQRMRAKDTLRIWLSWAARISNILFIANLLLFLFCHPEVVFFVAI